MKFSFEDALRHLKHGQKVAREGWNGKWMYLFIVPAGAVMVPHKFSNGYPVATDTVWMKTADDKIVPWLCSQTDMMARDWEVVSLPVRQDQLISHQ